ncbi:MAG: pyridoxamine 5'-phosphate oxidase family protein [Acidimicrobiia bacterium]|nr:pyridoxamine 5'-phosphate oxidase family protein [Acidimicrobiia bacterium]
MLNNNPHTKARLASDIVGWLTTVSAAGVPSTAPVWYMVDGDNSIMLYSRDPSVRVRNIAANPHVTLALNSDPNGSDIVVVNGTAMIDPSIPSAVDNQAYLERYQARLDAHKWTPEWFARNYPTPIRITITSIRGD